MLATPHCNALQVGSLAAVSGHLVMRNLPKGDATLVSGTGSHVILVSGTGGQATSADQRPPGSIFDSRVQRDGRVAPLPPTPWTQPLPTLLGSVPGSAGFKVHLRS